MKKVSLMTVSLIALLLSSPNSQEMLFDNSQLDSPGPESSMVSRAQIYGDPELAEEIYPGGSSYDDEGYSEYGLPERAAPTVEVQASENGEADGGDPTPDAGEDGTAEIGPYDGESPEEMQNPPPGTIPADEGSPADLAAGQSGSADGGAEDQDGSTLGSGGDQSEAQYGNGTGSGNQDTGADTPARNDPAGSGTQSAGGASGNRDSASGSAAPETAGSVNSSGNAAAEPDPGNTAEPEIRSEREGTLYRAADLIQARIINGSNEPGGTLADIVLNKSGRIEYFLVRLEDYAGMQSGLYLVGYDMVKVHPAEVRPEIRLELKLPEQDLIRAVNDLQVRQRIGPDSVLYTNFMRYDAGDPDGKNLGAIEDLVIDAERAEVVYAAFSPAGNLGSGGRLIAMPFRDLSYDVESGTVRIDAEAREIERARTFSPDEWPAEASNNWRPYF